MKDDWKGVTLSRDTDRPGFAFSGKNMRKLFPGN
jgi:hypothetical protein